MNNLITDLPGVLVGAAQDAQVASGVSVVVFEKPAVASIAIHGGAPALRDGALPNRLWASGLLFSIQEVRPGWRGWRL